jgi:hypothetical protein
MKKRDVDAHFGRKATDEKQEEAVRNVVNRLQNTDTGMDITEGLMAAVEAVLKEVPYKQREMCGWLDFNYECLAMATSERNEAARVHAKTKTVEAKGMLRAVRWLPWRVLYSTRGVLQSTRFLGAVDGTM